MRFDDPEDGIALTATLENADLIVLAPHLREGMEALRHPSVTARMLTRAPAPLLIFPDAMPSIGAKSLLADPKSRILVPLDGSERAEAALPLAMDLARYYDRELLLVRASTPPAYSPEQKCICHLADYAIAYRQEAESYLKEIATHVRDAGLRARTLVVAGPPEAELMALLASGAYRSRHPQHAWAHRRGAAAARERGAASDLSRHHTAHRAATALPRHTWRATGPQRRQRANRSDLCEIVDARELKGDSPCYCSKPVHIAMAISSSSKIAPVATSPVCSAVTSSRPRRNDALGYRVTALGALHACAGSQACATPAPGEAVPRQASHMRERIWAQRRTPICEGICRVSASARGGSTIARQLQLGDPEEVGDVQAHTGSP